MKTNVYPQEDPLRVAPGPENHFYVEHKIGLYYLLKILYSFSSKNTFDNTGTGENMGFIQYYLSL